MKQAVEVADMVPVDHLSQSFEHDGRQLSAYDDCVVQISHTGLHFRVSVSIGSRPLGDL